MIYHDALISITDGRIIFEHYYFPGGKRKSVRLDDVEWIAVRPPTLWNGRWRIHGTGNFKTWFPKDKLRPRREKIFFAKLKHGWVDIGFTVEDADQVESIFRKVGLLKAD